VSIAVVTAGVALLFSPAALVSAQQLPIRHYDVSDGLTHSGVKAIYQDAKGYLWAGTWDGLSRFDGYRFTNYGLEDGLEHSIINDVVEDRRGRLWVATNGKGVARLIEDAQTAPSLRHAASAPQVPKKFVSYLIDDTVPGANAVNTLFFDAQNTLWCLTDAGIYRAAVDSTGQLKFTLVLSRRDDEFLLLAALADSHGRLWFGGPDGVVQVEQDHVIRYRLEVGSGNDGIVSMVEDRHRRVLAAHPDGLIEFIAPMDSPAASSPGENIKRRGRWRRLPLALRPGQRVQTMLVDSGGTLWVGTSSGLIKFQDGQPTVYTAAQGLSNDDIVALGQDREGNLWIGTPGGLYKLSEERIVNFTKEDGLPHMWVGRIVEDHEGRIFASTGGRGGGGLVEIAGGNVVPIPGSQTPPFDNIKGRILQDRRGDWWIGTDEGLFRFQGPRLQLHQGKKFTAADGFTDKPIAYEQGIYEDPGGRIWISTWTGETGPDLYWFDPARRSHPLFQHISLEDIWPRGVVTQLMGDRSGTLWLNGGRLVNDKVAVLQPTEGLPETPALSLFQDSRGWLWLGSRRQGVSMTKNPAAERPTFSNYSTQNGLLSNTVRSITEDDSGRIYWGTEKGLNQFDPSTGRIRHITTAHGLAGDIITHCLKDRRGNIWVGTTSGVSKLTPHDERDPVPPPIYLSQIQAAGQNLSLPERGAQRLLEMTLPASQNNLRIEYVGLSFRGERALTYQYKLEGVDEDWTPPGGERAVNYARLSPSSYRFLVRAIHQEGGVSPEPAVFEFRILPPIWQRWWFLTLLGLGLAASGLALHRLRVRQALAMERIRRQIATDLHDDIGSGLSQVAILSEVAKRDASGPGHEMLTEVATLARTMRDSMSDIVWAVDPRKDHLADLVQRMRQVTFNLLETEGRPVEFHAPDEREVERIALAPDRRRHLLLIFKEAVTNIARHADATHVRIEIGVDAGTLSLTIGDDGRGFDPQNHDDGHGLHNLRQRSEALRADLRIESAPGHGTTVQVTVPL
jgi:ligand-binding sensor domain-containing protein/signal transduction histidine kinase